MTGRGRIVDELEDCNCEAGVEVFERALVTFTLIGQHVIPVWITAIETINKLFNLLAPLGHSLRR